MEADSKTILPLSDASASLAQVGGKGASLSRLAAAGLPVPASFHITTAAYTRFMTQYGLQEQILSILSTATPDQPASLEQASRQIGNLFAQHALPDDIADAIRQAYAGLGGAEAPVAVRSSATAEDLPEASFAGQQETYLNIRGEKALLEAVKNCWRSLWTARAIAYRFQNHINQNDLALAVVVQEMVKADAAGVLFSANPVEGRRDEIVINAAWGLGESIVGGRVSPDTYIVDKATGKIKQVQVAEKTILTVEAETGTRDMPLEDSRRRQQVLSEAQVARLAGLAIKIEDCYHQPQDVEWALAGEHFAILQARPITALPEPPLEWTLSQPHTIAARLSFVEFVPDAVPPLFATLAVPLATQATTKMMADVLGFRSEAGYYFEVLNGYVYSCINTRTMLHYGWYGILGSKKILRYGERRREEVQLNSRAAADKWRQADLTTLQAAELLAGVRELFSTTADYFTVAQSGAIPRSTVSESLFSSFYKTLVKRKTDPPPVTFLLGLDNLALQAEQSLFDLAQWVRGQAELADYVRQIPTQALWADLQADPLPAPLSGDFAARFADHLAAFGHTLYDLDFSKPIPADDPIPALNTLKVYLSGQGQSPHARLQAQAEQRRRAEQEITRRLDPLRRKWFRKLLKSAQDCAPGRENAIADLGLTYPQIRRLLRELGRRLVASNVLMQAQDVYWLEAGEADALASSLDKNEPLTSYTARVAARQDQWKHARQVLPPAALPEKSWFARLMPHKKTAGHALKGYGASAGSVTAPARILRSPEDFEQMHPGEVIVAVTTTPAWTPLFAVAAAVVTDIGGPLSHSSIVAREYGIPAVMATGSATRRIRSGQMITVDGSAGIVTMKD